jgi:hypothetical protein
MSKENEQQYIPLKISGSINNKTDKSLAENFANLCVNMSNMFGPAM